MWLRQTVFPNAAKILEHLRGLNNNRFRPVRSRFCWRNWVSVRLTVSRASPTAWASC